MTVRKASIIILAAVFAAVFSAGLVAGEYKDTELHEAFLAGDYEKVSTLGMRRYREMALAHPQDPAIHGFSLRVAVIGACRAEVMRILSDWQEKLRTAGSLTEQQVTYPPHHLYTKYGSFRSPLEGQESGLSQERLAFLKALETGLRRQGDLSLLRGQAKPDHRVPESGPNALIAAYFCATRSGKDFCGDYTALPADFRSDRLFESVISFWLKEQNRESAVDALLGAAEDLSQSEAGAPYLLRAARIRAEQGWHFEAADLYRRVVSEYPNSSPAPEAQYELAQLYVKAWGNFASAVTECQKLIRLFPRSPFAARAGFLIGQYYYQDGKYADASAALRAFRQEHPASKLNIHVSMLLGLGLIGEGRADEAIQEFQVIVQSHPEHELAPRAQYLIAYALLSEQKYDQALEEFRKLVDYHPHAKNVLQARKFIEKLSAARQK